jgi:hypothetical protein
VLRDRGVDVALVRTSAGVRDVAGEGDTVLVAFPDMLRPEQARTVRNTGADLVVVGAQTPGAFAPGVEVAGDTAPEGRLPGCDLTAAERAGSADMGGIAYEVRPGLDTRVNGCYPHAGLPSLLLVQRPGQTVTLLGSPAALTNDRFDDLGNASLALSLLGQNDRLLWYLPSLGDVAAEDEQSFYSLVPDGVWWGLAQALIAVLLLMFWRARRLGPVVAEHLPVVVRAAETVEGRARLYRRARARDKAADSLRAGALRRLVPLLGLPRHARPAEVVDAVAARTRRTPPDPAALLYGAAPADDAALVRLANDLDALDREIRRP